MTLFCLFPLSVHITCKSHIVRLVTTDFQKVFMELNKFFKCFRNFSLFVLIALIARFYHFKTSLGVGSDMKPLTAMFFMNADC